MPKFRALIAACAVVSCVTPAAAQSQQFWDLQSFYALWGMMDGAANVCWEISGSDPAYMSAGEDWKARNVILREEFETTLAASGEAASLAPEGETIGSTQLHAIIRGADNPVGACQNWLTNVTAGAYEGETYLADQLGRLRERDGL